MPGLEEEICLTLMPVICGCRPVLVGWTWWGVMFVDVVRVVYDHGQRMVKHVVIAVDINYILLFAILSSCLVSCDDLVMSHPLWAMIFCILVAPYYP